MSVDIPRAWQIARTVEPEKHDRNCSHRTTKGALLCDCDVLFKHPEVTDLDLQGRDGVVIRRWEEKP